MHRHVPRVVRALHLTLASLAAALPGCGSTASTATAGPPARAPAAAAAWPAPPPSAAPRLPAPPATAALAPAAAASERRFRLPLVDREQTRAVVLLYHAFDVGREKLSVSSRDLDRQLEVLSSRDVELVTTTELVEFLEGRRALPARVAVLTIDDGMASVYTRAWPLLRSRGARFTVGIPTGLVGTRSRAGSNMSWDQLREMVGSGLCEVVSHGHLHRRLPGLGEARRREELELSRALITREIGRAPVAYFYPLGAHDLAVERLVRAAGYRAAFVASGAPVALGSTSAFAVPRTSVFHGDSASLVAQYVSDGFLGRARARPERVALVEAEPRP